MRHKPSLTCSTLPSEWLRGPGRFAMHRYPLRLNFSYHCLMLFFTGRSFFSPQDFVLKLHWTDTIDCARAYWSTQKAFFATVAAIFTQPAPLVVIEETKRPLHAKYPWRVSLSICGSQVEVLCVIQVYRFCEMCQVIMNNPAVLLVHN